MVYVDTRPPFHNAPVDVFGGFSMGIELVCDLLTYRGDG